MSNRISAVSTLLKSPIRILGIVLALVFTVEVAVMFVLPYLLPESLGETGGAVLDAILLTLICAPALWWVIIGPLRRIAIQEHERSETIVAGASEGILTFDQQGWIASCNRAGGTILGQAADLLIGKAIQKLIPQLPSSFDALPCDFRLKAVRSDGSELPVQVSISEFPSETDRLLIAIIRDLTASAKAEQERIMMARETEALRAQQMATLAQLATGVAHEIRNPLTSIKLLIQVNLAKFAKEGFETDDLELVEQEIRRMERSVNGLLEYARPEAGEFNRFPIDEALRRTVQLIQGRCQAQSVSLNVASTDESMCVYGDRSQLQQLFLNLAINALDAMPSGGSLEITVSRLGSNVEVTIGDTGPGIDDRIVGKLFTPFVTTKPNGVGLGLGICQRIAEAHQGTLSGANRMAGGALFRLLLPDATHQSAQSSHPIGCEELCKVC